MIQACIAAITIGVLVLMSVRANQLFKDEDRLPMQWSIDGSVNWTAPRPIALAFTPTLAAIILPATAALTTVLKPRPGQEGLVIPALVVVGFVFIAVHAFHLWLIRSYLGRKG